MPICEPIVFQIAHKTWCINEFGMDALFLLEGEDKALLIDTGTGVFDLPAVLRRYTDKPLQTVLTHGHIDHAGGIGWFPKVYLHPEDFALARSVTPEQRRDYVRTMLTMSENLYDLKPEQVTEEGGKTQFCSLADGTVLHLGGRDVVVYETPGHTAGGVSFLDVRERIIFTGDACNPNTLLSCSEGPGVDRGTVGNLLASAKKIEALRPFYDRNYNGHIGYAAHITQMNPMPECLTRDCIELCTGLLDGSRVGTPDETNPFMGPCLMARNHTMQVLYHPSQLR